MIIVPRRKLAGASAVRVVRVITVDGSGDEQWWDLEELRSAHPDALSCADVEER